MIFISRAFAIIQIIQQDPENWHTNTKSSDALETDDPRLVKSCVHVTSMTLKMFHDSRGQDFFFSTSSLCIFVLQVVPLALMTRGEVITLPHIDPASNRKSRKTTVYRGVNAAKKSLRTATRVYFNNRFSLFAMPGVGIAMC